MAAESTVLAPPSDAAAREQTRNEETYVPCPVDIYEDDQGLVILADLPGVEPDAVEVRVDKNILTIQGRAKHLAKGEPIYREFELTGFYRQFELPDDFDPNPASAELKNGVLMLRLPRSERAKPRKIEVRAS